MGYGWLGTFRVGQWKAFRSLILKERRDAGARIATIQAELRRIGQVTVYYGATTNEGSTTYTEERVGFAVTENSSLGKLIQAYIAQGGNPFDISLFLSPDSTYVLEDSDIAVQTQPYGGVIYPRSGSYATSGIYEGGWLVVKKSLPQRVGGIRELPDYRLVTLVSQGRGWLDQTIQHRLHDLESRIIKLCDLREQLQHEIDVITLAIGGTSEDVPILDSDYFPADVSVAHVVASLDAVIFATVDGVPDLDQPMEEQLIDYPSILLDILPDEANTAL